MKQSPRTSSSSSGSWSFFMIDDICSVVIREGILNHNRRVTRLRRPSTAPDINIPLMTLILIVFVETA